MKETNMEHFRSEIEEMRYVFAVIDGEIKSCDDTVCNDCAFRGKCMQNMNKWLMSEYKPEPVLTEREKGFVECIKDGYIARDHEGTLEWYKEKPQKLYGCWLYSKDQTIIYLNREMFSFITWEDEEPWSIERLRELKVQDAD